MMQPAKQGNLCDASGLLPPPKVRSISLFILQKYGGLGNVQFIRICSPEVMDLEQVERRPVRQHQSSDRGTDSRQGIAGRPPSPPALFTRHTERGESHGHAGGTFSYRA